MGTSHSIIPQCHNSPNGSLIINLDKPFSFTGENVTGHIWIKLNKGIETYGLELNLFLEEFWLSHTGKEIHTDKNEQAIINSAVNIQNALIPKKSKFVLQPGEYRFNFNFILPDYLNPSFEYTPEKFKSHLRYILVSQLLSFKGDKYPMSNLTYLVVCSKPLVLNSPLHFSNCSNVHSWFIFEAGTTVFNISYPKNNFTFGEQIPLHATIDNARGKLLVIRLKICLIRKIEYSSVKRSDKFNTEEILMENIIPLQVQPGTKYSVSTNLVLSDSEAIMNSYNNIDNPLRHLMVDKRQMIRMIPSLSSTMIKCEYYIKASLKFESFVEAKSRPRIFMPLSITHQVMDGRCYSNENIPSNNPNYNMPPIKMGNEKNYNLNQTN